MHRIKRLPVIRHIRYWYLKRQVYKFAYSMYRCGIGLGHPNPSDLEVLEKIWKGEL